PNRVISSLRPTPRLDPIHSPFTPPPTTHIYTHSLHDALPISFAYIFIGIVIAERLIELKIAAKNESWMKQHGGFEVGKGHYKLFIIMHVAFFLSLMVELQYITVGFHISLFILFMLVQLCRVWCMLSLGRFWNTKIIVLPSVAVIKTGPYKYMKHPNYVIVFAELFLLPAMFGALWTASLFPLLHMSLLSVRI